MHWGVKFSKKEKKRHLLGKGGKKPLSILPVLKPKNKSIEVQ